MKLRHSEEDFEAGDFVPPELRNQDYTPDIEAPEMIPSGELSGVDEAPVVPAPKPPSREEMLRKVLAEQEAKDSERAGKMSAAARKDRKAQASANVIEYIRAAFTRSNPQLRNVGQSHTQAASSDANNGPLSRELQLQKILSQYETKPVDPRDSLLKDLRIKEAEQGLQPKPAKGIEYLTPAEQSSIEATGIRLAKDEQGRTRKDLVPTMTSFASAGEGRKQAQAQFGTRLAEERGKEARSEEKTQQGMEVPGWSRDPSVRVDEPDVRMLRDASAQTQTLKSGLNKLEALYRKYGNTKLPSAERAAVKLLVTDLKLQAKGPAMYQLGVLSKQDDELLSQVVPDPAGGGGMLSDFFSGGENTLSKISTLRGQLDDRISAKMGSRGYKSKTPAKPVWNGRAWEVPDGT